MIKLEGLQNTTSNHSRDFDKVLLEGKVPSVDGYTFAVEGLKWETI